VTLLSTALTSLQDDNGAIKEARNVGRGMLPVFRKRSFGGVARYISQLATFNFTSSFNCCGRDYSQEIPCLVWNQTFPTLFIITRHRCLYKARWMQSTDLLLRANFYQPPTHARPSPSNSTTKAPLHCSSLPCVLQAPPNSYIICSPRSFIPLETTQYYNFVFYNIYVFTETKKKFHYVTYHTITTCTINWSTDQPHQRDEPP
jgi:hypothetical protein